MIIWIHFGVCQPFSDTPRCCVRETIEKHLVKSSPYNGLIQQLQLLQLEWLPRKPLRLLWELKSAISCRCCWFVCSAICLDRLVWYKFDIVEECLMLLDIILFRPVHHMSNTFHQASTSQTLTPSKASFKSMLTLKLQAFGPHQSMNFQLP